MHHFWRVELHNLQQFREESANEILSGLGEPIRFSLDWERFPFLAQI